MKQESARSFVAPKAKNYMAKKKFGLIMEVVVLATVWSS